MSNVLALGSTAAQSSTFTVTPGAPATISLIGPTPILPPNLTLQLEKQGSDSAWYPVADVREACVVYGSGSYRLNRSAGSNVGADVD